MYWTVSSKFLRRRQNWHRCPWFAITDIAYVLRTYRGADKSLARPTSRCIVFDGENVSFDASLVYMCVCVCIYIYIYSTNIPPIMIINRIYETQNLLSL